MKKFYLLILIIFFSVLGLFTYEYKNLSVSDITFSHISDIHIEKQTEKDGKTPTYPERLLNDAIFQINNNEDNDFTIITGDIINAPDTKLFEHVVKIFNNLKKPWYYALGNHDCSYPIVVEKQPLIDIVEKYNKNFVPDGRIYTFSPEKGFTFIALDGGSYDIDEYQVDYMNNVIKKHPFDTIIIFLHTPIKPPVDMHSHTLWNTDSLLENFEQFNQPIAIFAGHFHVTKIIKDGNILHVATPSLRYAQDFRTVKVKNEKDKVIFDFDYRHTGLKEKFPQKSRYEGEEEDKNAVVILKRNIPAVSTLKKFRVLPF